MSDKSHMSFSSRRNFLKTSGSLMIGFPLLGIPVSTHLIKEEKLPGSLRRTPKINAWLEVLEDGRVRIFSGKAELGQGIQIAIKQVAAEELYMNLDQVEVIMAETGRTPNEGYTAGSGSIQNSAMAVRHVAAFARERLLQMAGTKLKTPVGELRIKKGRIYRVKGTESLSFADVLAGKQIEEEAEMPIRLKPKSEYQFVGKPIHREDTKDIITGKPTFVQDLQFEGMVHARVLRPKNYKSSLLNFDQSAFESASKGLLKTVVNGSFMGVISATNYEAEKAVKLLEKHTEWSQPASLPKQEKLKEYLKKNAEPLKIVKETGIKGSALAVSTHKASYFKPYIMHASLGPACAVAMYDDDILHVWTNSQGIYPLREALTKMLNMPTEQVHLISVPGPGVFGHTTSDDAAADAALLAMAYPNKHIMVQWSREDENAWEPYGSAMIVEVEANLDKSGTISRWVTDVWSDSQSTRPNKDAGTVLPARYLADPMPMKGRGYLNGGHRNADPYYDIPNLKVNAHFFDGPLRVSSLRSLAAYGNIFAIESFMDELAIKAGKEPLAFRLAHLKDSRAIDVVKKVREMTRNHELNSNEGIGYAFCRYKNRAAYCAVAAKVAVESGEVMLRKMWAAVDVGEVINPDGLRNQTEGGLIQAASWTLKEAVNFSETEITSTSWGAYPTLKFSETPEVEVAIIDRPNEPAMGGGEASVPPVAAAIANAVFQACGQRVYELPIRLGEMEE